MAHKTITISEEAYDILASHKLEGESFTEEIKRLLGERKKGSLRAHFGAWTMSDEEFARLFEEISEEQSEARMMEARTRSA